MNRWQFPVWATVKGLMVVAILSMSGPANAGEIDSDRLLNADKNPSDWLTYHGSYKSWHYSALDQINTRNVKNLQVAWTHMGGRAFRGVESMPLVADGILYYSGSYNQVWALDGATGEVLWVYKQKLNEELVGKQTHSPFNRGIALGYGNVYMGTLDGKLVAIDMQTGKLNWETKLVQSEKLTVGFTGAPLVVKDKVIIGAQGGEWPSRGPIFGVDARDGKQLWVFYTVADDDVAKATWGGDSWMVGGGGGWMPGSYDPESDTVWWGTANPAPQFDYAGSEWMTKGARPGINLYTDSVIALDPDTGVLKFYHQEIPHDTWDYDSAAGELVMIERDGKKLVVHGNKDGHIFVYDRSNAGIVNVWPLIKNLNFVQSIDPKTGELIGRHDLDEGKHTNVCPCILGGINLNSGSYNPETRLYYRVGNEWCMNVEVVKTNPILEPMAQLYIGANVTLTNPEGGKAHAHVSARDPVTGEKKWEVIFPEPPLASLLSTKGNLLFVPDTRGYLRAYDVSTGKELWKHNDGQAHIGGTISYMANGKQYIAVTTGWGNRAALRYPALFGGPYINMPMDAGSLVVFSLP